MSGDFTFLKGNIETIILCALYKEPTYGYEIAKEIKERTGNKYEIKQPTLYSYLKRLEEDDLIVSYWGETSNGGRRRYYALTKTGRANCEHFISEWQYQRTVLSELVDGTANGTEITQDEATPLFGRRTRRTKKKEYQTELDEQDEIARRLSELTGTTFEQEAESDSIVEETVADTPAESEEPFVGVQESINFEENTADDVVEQQEQEPTVIERIIYVDRPIYIEKTIVNEEKVAEIAPQVDQKPEEDPLARFETNQDNPEDFIQAFDERAREVSATEPHTEGENYQHVLMGVIGEQLDGMDQINTDPATTMYYEDHHAALEDVADSLAKEGIRLRIYNHATAAYKSKTLIPFAKVLCQTSWLTYAIGFIIFGVLALTSIALSNWVPFVITLAVLLIVPIGFTVYAILDPTRKEKPIFNFRIAIIVASVICVIIVLAAVGFSAIGNMEFSDYVAASKQILIPTGIAVLIPAGVAIYYCLYKQY
ncbi:MAG: helix-turn-helix transcriptional regulator [Clostridiales bacterium]|nr:helix-turn-helix transcriptional regulator [Clostridiales bacterium]